MDFWPSNDASWVTRGPLILFDALCINLRIWTFSRTRRHFHYQVRHSEVAENCDDWLNSFKRKRFKAFLIFLSFFHSWNYYKTCQLSISILLCKLFLAWIFRRKDWNRLIWSRKMIKNAQYSLNLVNWSLIFHNFQHQKSIDPNVTTLCNFRVTSFKLLSLFTN